MLITLEIDKEKFKKILQAELFNENIFDTDTRITIVKEIQFNEEDFNLLAILAEDESEDIRRLVALNENTSAETLEELSFDDSDEVRKALTLNANISEEILEDLVDDDSQIVSDAASLRMESQTN